MTNQKATLEQIPNIFQNPKATGWIEGSEDGKSGRYQLSKLAEFILSQKAPTESTALYFKTVPAYSISAGTPKVFSVQAGGVVQKGSQTISPAAKDLTLSAIANEENARFDAVVYDSVLLAYKLITGQEGDNPTQPLYNTQTEVLLTYVLTDVNGPQNIEAPNTHEQNKDQYLDFGGPNQVSAAQIKTLIDTGSISRKVNLYTDLAGLPDKKDNENVFVIDASADESVSYGWAIYKYLLANEEYVKIAEAESVDVEIPNSRDLGHFSTLGDLESSYPSPPENSFATVSEGRLIYMEEGGVFVPYGGSGSGTQELQFLLYHELDTRSPEAMLKGNKIEFKDLYFSSNLSSASIFIGLDIPNPTFSEQSTIAELNAWISANIPDTETRFLVYAFGTYPSGKSGNASINLKYSISL